MRKYLGILFALVLAASFGLVPATASPAPVSAAGGTSNVDLVLADPPWCYPDCNLLAKDYEGATGVGYCQLLVGLNHGWMS